MNILLLCDEYPPGRHGGIGTAVQLQARTMAGKGHNVIVAGFYQPGYGGSDEFVDQGVKVFRFRRMLTSSIFGTNDALTARVISRVVTKLGISSIDVKASLKRYGRFLNELIERFAIDIVEMPDYNDFIRFCKSEVSFPKLNAPVVVKLHGSMTYFNEEAGLPTPKYVRRIEEAILAHSDAVTSVSRYTADKTAKYLRYSKPITVLYNGIQVPAIDVLPEKVKGLVVFTGSLVEKKGIYQLIKAWRAVSEKLPGARLHVYGKGPVRKIVSLLPKSLHQTVAFKGHVDRRQLFSELSSAEVAVFPSYAECFALAPMEAMSCGTAVVYTKRSSGPELIEQGNTGMLIEPDNIIEISDALITLLTDESLCNTLANNGKTWVENMFNIDSIVDEHIIFYKKVIEQTTR